MATPEGGFGFPARLRLKRRSDFRRVYDGGRSSGRRFLVVYAQSREDGPSEPTRLGITASRRLGKAVVRNAFKRRIREIFRLHRAGVLPGHDLVVNARVAASDADYRQLEKDFLSCVKQLGLLNPGDPTPPCLPGPAPSGDA